MSIPDTNWSEPDNEPGGVREVKGEGGLSAAAMDRVVERKRIDKRILIEPGAGAILLLTLLFWMFAPRSDLQTVNPTG